MNSFSAGFAAYREAWSVLGRAKLWRWVMIPGVLSLLAGGAILVFGWSQTAALSEWVVEKYPFETAEELVRVLSRLLAGALMLIVMLFLFRYLVMVVISPFMSILSEKAEMYLTRQAAPPVNLAEMLGDLVRGVRIALRNVWLELVFTLLIFLGGLLVPVIGQAVSAVLIFGVQAYYAGFGNFDYTLERKRYTVRQSVQFMRQHRLKALANGTAFLLLLFVPFLGLFLAPALGTVAGVIVLRRELGNG